MAIPVYTYPHIRRNFQKIFMRIDIIKTILDIQGENAQRDEIESSIYLPLPIGLLRENHSLTYEATEFEILGELVKQNYDAVMKNGLNASSIESAFSDEAFDKYGDILARTSKTALDAAVANFSALGADILKQGVGIVPRANYTMLFKGIDQPRDFILEWNLFPKNYEDANSVEKIIRIIQKASLPDLINKTLFDSAYAKVENFISEKSEVNDVSLKTPKVTSGLYSVAYNIPRKIKIKLFERINDDNEGNIEESTDVREITHLMNFPFEMVIRNIIVEHTEDTINTPFVEYVNPDGNIEYFHTTYKLRLSISDTELYTSNEVNSSVNPAILGGI